MSSSRLPHTKWLIRSLSMAEAQELARQSLEMTHPEQIRQLVRDRLEERGLGEILSLMGPDRRNLSAVAVARLIDTAAVYVSLSDSRSLAPDAVSVARAGDSYRVTTLRLKENSDGVSLLVNRNSRLIN